MKRYEILYVLMLLVFASCSGNKEAMDLFVRVDSIMNEHPDSVLSLLDSSRVKKDSWHKAERMRYELLYAKAQNKAYVDFTTDSIMKEVVAYYDAYGTANEQMEAHYLLGCTYRDLHESPLALSCYLDATEKADTLSDDCDYGTLMRIWGQVANEFNNQAMPYKELEALEKYRKYALKSKNTFDYIVGIELDKRAYLLMQDTIRTIKTIEKAYRLYIEYGFRDYAEKAIYPIIPLYIETNNIQKAKETMNLFESKSGLMKKNGEIEQGHEHYYNTKAELYLALEKLDSAEYYLRKLLSAGYKYDAYKGLLSLFERESAYDSICKYSRLKEDAFAESYTHLHTQAMFNADGMFNYSRNQRIALEKEVETINMRNKAILVCLVCLYIMIVASFLFYKYKTKKELELKRKEEQYLKAEENYIKSQEDYCLMQTNFDAYKQKKEIELQLQEERYTRNELISKKAKEEYALMLADINAYKEQKEDEIKILKQKCEELSLIFEKSNIAKAISEIRNSNTYKAFISYGTIKPNCTISIPKKQWKSMHEIFKNKMPHFYYTFIQNKVLSEQEREIIILTVLGESSKNIATLLNTSAANVSNAKSRINNKLFSDASAKTLYKNITDFGSKKT